jgi:type II secretory pathway component GspD/PulD (secretin)
MNLGAFLRSLADEAAISVIVEGELEGKTVTMEVRDQPVDQVLALVARRLGVDLKREGDLYYLGMAKPEDRGVLVRRVRRLSQTDLSQALGVFGGQQNRAAQFADGLIVVADTVGVLARVNEMLDQIEAADTSVWIVQLHLVSYTRNAADELGINLEPAAKAGLAFATGSAAATAGTSFELAASLDAVLQVAYSRDDVAVTAAPMFILSDGEKSSFVQGDRVPIPRRTVSPEGTVTTAGFDFVQTGVNVELALRETEARGARVDVTLSMSDVKRFVESAPVTGEERFQTSAVVKAGGVYLLGTLVKDRVQGRRVLGWQAGDYATYQAQVVQVWIQAYRIGSAVVDPAASRPAGMQGVDAPPGPEPVNRESAQTRGGAGAGSSGWRSASSSSEE